MSQNYKGRQIPAYTDPADAPTAFAEFVDSGPIPRFTDADNRDGFLPSPVAGMVCYITSLGRFQHFDGAQWVTLGSPIDANTLQGSAASAFATAGHTHPFEGYVQVKTSDQAGVSNTFVNDSHLVFAMGANQRWQADLLMFCDAGGTTFAATFRATVPTGATGYWARWDGLRADLTANPQGPSTFDVSSFQAVRFQLYVKTAGTAGNFTLGWYNAGHSTAMVGREGSTLIARQLT